MAIKGSSSVISVGGFICLMLLFAIPVVGWVICIIMAVSSGNENRRNFARATLVLMLIGLVLSVIMFFISRGVGSILSGYMPFLM